MVYVINKNNKPLMPCSNRKARLLLKQNKAIVVNRTPFTIKLLYGSSGYTQPINLGVDAGSKTIGLSATTKSKVLYESEVILRNDIVDLLSTRRQNRRTRRNRKTRYRKCRFLNRVHSKNKGWLAPSIENKIQSHLIVIDKVCKILPIYTIVVEVAPFDTQLLKAQDYDLPLPEGIDYQNGNMKGYNTREYVLFRDNHKCRCCKGKTKDPILQTLHIESRKVGGNAPNNLVTLCKTCHSNYHKGLIKLPDSIHRGNSYKDATFMGIMRWTTYNRLRELHNDKHVYMTYGYITKHNRIEANLPKAHYTDARCISGNHMVKPLGYVFYQKKVRCHNRQIHKNTILKGGYRKLNQAPYIVKGFRLFDKVLYNNQECFITGRRTSGYFALKTLTGNKVHNSAKSQDLKLLETAKLYLCERRSITTAH